jgi:hypothetical protein
MIIFFRYNTNVDSSVIIELSELKPTTTILEIKKKIAKLFYSNRNPEFYVDYINIFYKWNNTKTSDQDTLLSLNINSGDILRFNFVNQSDDGCGLLYSKL